MNQFVQTRAAVGQFWNFLLEEPAQVPVLLCLFKGADTFCAKVNLEVQRASEAAIAAVERNGGVISTSYYDPRSLGESRSVHARVNIRVAWTPLTFRNWLCSVYSVFNAILQGMEVWLIQILNIWDHSLLHILSGAV